MYINPRSVDDVLKTIKLVGLVLGAVEEAGELVEYVKSYIDLVKDRVKGIAEESKIEVYYELGDLGNTVGYGTFTNELIPIASGLYIALKASTKEVSEAYLRVHYKRGTRLS